MATWATFWPICPSGDRPREIERLVSALSEVRRRFGKTDAAGLMTQEYIDPEVAVSPQDAFYAAKESSAPARRPPGGCAASLSCATRRASPSWPRGSGSPAEIVDYIQYAKEKGCSMTGPEDPDIRRLNVSERSALRRQMEFWFSEHHTPNVKFSIRVDRQLYSGKSEFQRIDVFDSPEFGRFLTLDGYMMLTEKDEFIYHEMITHVPMAVHPHVRDVLVIGAGDGGVIRELTRYPDMEHIDMVEIDPLVVEVCKKYLPKTACRLDDPRLTIHYEDGLKFIRSKEN